MKIAIFGYSGSGKSTLARRLSEFYNLPVLHIDTVHHLPGWVSRDREESKRIVDDFLNSNDSWVIDGNYFKLSFERRMEEADEIIILEFNRFNALFRAYKRYRKYKNTTRPDMTPGCNEKFDFEFIKWILHGGRKRKTKLIHKNIKAQYKDKVTVLKNQKQIDKYVKKTMERNA
ncbi:MAG: DNA topology modulation protein [Acholeplasmatales bacterium]|nr:DNA topology modulation protein [Acholeplasmatales bacterium]